jgi:amino-acid N-acetyltransferase
LQELLRDLEQKGIVIVRSEESLAREVNTFVVIEREARIISCAQLKPLGKAINGAYESVAEIAGFAVHPDFRGVGRGDSLLDWIEQDARFRGHDCLVLLTTRTADWFQARDFRLMGSAHESELLSAWRREVVDPVRNSQLYMKRIEAPERKMPRPGKRIGF